VPEQPVAPVAQSTWALEVEIADGPDAAGVWPAKVSSGPEEAWESVAAWQPPWVTVQSPPPEDVFARPPSMAASAPVASERTLPEQLVEPAGQVSDPDASDTDANPPDTPGLAAAPVPELPPVAVACSTGGVNWVAELDREPQLPPVAAQSVEPVEVLATAAAAFPVAGSIVTSPDPVEEVFDAPLPEQSA